MESTDLRTGETLNRKRADHKKLQTSDSIQLTLAIAAIIISIIAAVVLAVCTTMHRQRNSQFKNETSEGQACVRCSTFTHTASASYSEYPLLLSQLTRKHTKDGVEMCCVQTVEQWSTFLNLMMWNPDHRAPLETFYPANFSFSPASLHKRLLPSDFQPELEVPKFLVDDENVTLIFDANVTDSLTEHVRGVELMQTQAVILHTGLYYVYSSVFFKPDSARPCKDYVRQTWYHNIVLTRDYDRDSGIIFRSSHTCCDDCIRQKDTSFTGGTFELKKYDKLHVEVSGYSLVSFRKEGSFFGMVMLNGDFRDD